jgi:hypothetical protein
MQSPLHVKGPIAALVSLCLGQTLAAQSVKVVGATPTQAVVSIQNANGFCALALSESSSLAPLAHDVDPTLYPGSNIDMFRADTVTQSGGTRLVTLGHMTGNRALAAATTYYLRVSGCGATVSATIATPTVGIGTTMQWPVPIDPSGWGELGFPNIDLVNRQTYIDPLTGVRMIPINLAGHWSWRTGGGWTATYPLTQTGSNAFADYAGGSGWNNPADVLNGPSSDASTGSTSPIDLYTGQETPDGSPWHGWHTLDDLGVLIYGSASSGSAPDNKISVCIFLNPSSGCVGQPIIISLPARFAQVASAGSDPDHPWPASFPSPLFAGWGINAPIPAEQRMSSGTLSAANGVLTLASINGTQYFSDVLSKGNRIKIAGSGCSPNSMCTIASVANAASATSAERISVNNAAFSAYGWGIRIQKLTAKGTIVVGARWKAAGSESVGTQAGTPPCSFVQVTSGDGKTGYVCEVNSPQSGSDYLYFIADDGTVRRFSAALVPNHQAQLSSMAAADRPNSGNNIPYYPLGFDPVNPNWFYVACPNNSGSTSIYQLAYGGDYTQDLDFQYAGGSDTTLPDSYAPALDRMTWSNLMPPSQGRDLNSQVVAGYPNYNAAIFGDWKHPNFAGVSGGKAFFYNLYSGQDGGPAWIAVVDLPSGNLSNLIHTADGTGTNGLVRWAAEHSVQAVNSSPNTMFQASNILNSNNSSKLLGGPFVMPVLGVSRGGSFSLNTALPWPPDSSYDSACPATNPYVSLGATGNQCVTLRLPAGGPCNPAPTPAELAQWPCPWNPSYSQPIALAVGDSMVDFGKSPGDQGDNEHFRVLSITALADGSLSVVAQRDSMPDYCCFTGDHLANGVSNCLDSVGQVTHANGWQVMMTPGQQNACNSQSAYLNLATGAAGEVSRLYAGHGDLAAGVFTSGNLSYITATAVKQDAPFSSLFSLPTVLTPIGYPSFAGTTLPIGSNLVQSYVTRIRSNQPPALVNAMPWMIDDNSLNDGYGGQSLGSRTLTRVSGNIYQIQVLGLTPSNLNYKTFPLIGWAGRYALKDVSGPNSSISRDGAFTVCDALLANECVPGSQPGSVYVNVPSATDDGNCDTASPWANLPCVVSGLPSGGGFRQQGIDAPDPNGNRSRFLGYLFASPGQHYSYTAVEGLTDGQIAIATGSHFVRGWGPIAWAIPLPPWQDDGVKRNQWLSIAVQVPAGARYAEVQFGYSRYGLPAQFRCTPRADGCNTSSPQGVPFNFESETRTLTSCQSGCTIQVPVVAPNLVYYRVRQSPDGVNWTSGDIQVGIQP